jgi:16S rRNA G1207 methylase RsmC
MTVYANEINKDMCLLLKDIIQKVSQDDFMNFEHMKFDKIIMNPPFNKKQDYNHIKKAIALLNN